MIRFECDTNVDVNALNKAFFTMKNTGCTGYKIIISEKADPKVLSYEETQIVNDGYTIDIFINETLKDNVTDLVIEQVKKSGEFVSTQEPVFIKDLMVSGKLDIVGYRHPTNTDILPYFYIIEVKSFYGYYATKEIMGCWSGARGNKVYNFGTPKPQHVLQAALYSYVLKDRCIGTKLFYIARDGANTQEFAVLCKPVVENGEEIHRIEIAGGGRKTPYLIKDFTIEEMLRRFGTLQEHLTKEEPPDREFYKKYPVDLIKPYYENGYISKTDFEAWDKKKSGKENHSMGDFECSYCSYKNGCWEDRWE